MNKEFELSSYQENILNFVKYKTGNLLVDAKAGAGKTSTLLLIADELTNQNKKCLFLSFNKHIAEEIGKKLNNNENCMSKTVHSLGFTFLRSYLYKKHNTNYELVVDTTKLREIVKQQYNKLCFDKIQKQHIEDMSEDDLKTLHNDLISDFVKLCNFSRYYNINYKATDSLKPLIYKHCDQLNNYVPEIPNYQQVVINSLDYTKYLFENPEINDLGQPVYVVDYVDMLYFPVYYNMYVPFSIKSYLDTVLVDEAQDLSILQQMFIKKLTTNDNRFIFVGDAKQAIYGFAGADTNSINNIKRLFVLDELPLNICYRCPEKVVKVAKSIVPSIEWNTKREDKGIVELIDRESLYSRIANKDVIIGRKNKDLLKIYRTFVLTHKRPIKFRNIEMVNSLVNDLENVIKEYIHLYNKGYNIDKQLKLKMEQLRLTETNQEIIKEQEDKFIKELVLQNLSNKVISKSKFNLSYLTTCMNEYKEEGSYNYENDLKTTEYFEIIESFIEDYKQTNNSELVTSFIKYLKTFLTKGLDEDLPIISSIHAMKGGEADNVFIYDYPRFPYKFSKQSADERQQEVNLQYVALTRAKKNLYLLKLSPEEDKDNLNLECEVEIEQLIK